MQKAESRNKCLKTIENNKEIITKLQIEVQKSNCFSEQLHDSIQTKILECKAKVKPFIVDFSQLINENPDDDAVSEKTSKPSSQDNKELDKPSVIREEVCESSKKPIELAEIQPVNAIQPKTENQTNLKEAEEEQNKKQNINEKEKKQKSYCFCGCN